MSECACVHSGLEVSMRLHLGAWLGLRLPAWHAWPSTPKTLLSRPQAEEKRNPGQPPTQPSQAHVSP